MTKQIRLFGSQGTIQLVCWLLLLWVIVSVNTARRGPRRKTTSKVVFTKRQYDEIVKNLLTEKRYEDYASDWMNYIVNLENNVTSQIYNPVVNGGERLCSDIQLLNQELELVLIPLKQEKSDIVYIARRLFIRNGPKFIFELLPNNKKLKSTFNWDDYQLSTFYRLWLETRMIWEEFKEAYILMKAKCYHLGKL